MKRKTGLRWVSVGLGLAAAGCAGQSQTRKSSEADKPPTKQVSHSPSARKLSALAQDAYNNKAYLECGRLSDQAELAAPYPDPLLPYNAACCWAMGQDRNHAFAALARAISQGYRRLPNLQSDTDLLSLHSEARWNTVLEGTRKNLDTYTKSLNPELERLFAEDQADRRGAPSQIDWKEVTPRDEARRIRVSAIIAAGDAKVSADYYNAAMVFQHGESLQDIETANRLAREAVRLDDKNLEARWLVAASHDRALMKAGKRQDYGTQKVSDNGCWKLYPVESRVTDDERAQWNVPSLEEAQAQVDALNKDGAR